MKKRIIFAFLMFNAVNLVALGTSMGYPVSRTFCYVVATLLMFAAAGVISQ